MSNDISLHDQLAAMRTRFMPHGSNAHNVPSKPVQSPNSIMIPVTCAITGWNYTVDIQPPRGQCCPHPAILHGTSWQLPAVPSRGQLILALGACLYSLYQIGLYDPRAPLNPTNFSNHWLLDSLGCIRDTVVHCVKVGTLCRKRYPRLVGDSATTSQHIEHWLNSIDRERSVYEPMSLVNKAEESLTQRILATLSKHATSEQSLRIAAYGYRTAKEAGWSQDHKAAVTLVATIQRPQFASYDQLKDTQSILWEHAPQESDDDQRLLLAIIQRIDSALVKYMVKDVETKAAYINASLAGGHNIFEEGLKAMMPAGQAAKMEALEAKKEISNNTFANKFAMQLAKLQQLKASKK